MNSSLLEERKDRNSAAVVLFSMARAFRVEDGHPLDSTAEAAVNQIVQPSARAWIVWQGAAAVAHCIERRDSK